MPFSDFFLLSHQEVVYLSVSDTQAGEVNLDNQTLQEVMLVTFSNIGSFSSHFIEVFSLKNVPLYFFLDYLSIISLIPYKKSFLGLIKLQFYHCHTNYQCLNLEVFSPHQMIVFFFCFVFLPSQNQLAVRYTSCQILWGYVSLVRARYHSSEFIIV